MNYFQVNVNYDRQTGEDNPGRVKESYLVPAVTCGEAENAVLERIKPMLFGDCETPKIQKKSYFDLFMDSPDCDIYYEAKVEMIVIDGDKELRKPVKILVFAKNIRTAIHRLLSNLANYDCEVISIKKTGITDILSVEKSE